MYHERMKKSHYEAGYEWGRRLFRHGKLIMDQPTFVVDEKRKLFAKQCLPLYERHYPEILAEIKGVADGQCGSYEDFYTFLFSMYCFSLEQHCTCIAYHEQGKTLLARNSDFLVTLEKLNMNCLYCLEQGYAFQGNTTAFIEMEDGINEYGLAIGLTFVYPKLIRPGLQAGMLLRYLLEKCKSVKEATTALKKLPIASSQIFTIADAYGDIAVAECNSCDVEIILPKKNYLAAANVFHSERMQCFNETGIDNWRAEERYHVADSTLNNYQGSYDRSFVESLLSGKYGFMCQYDRKQNADTVWSVIYDITEQEIYRSEGNPMRKRYQKDSRMKFQYNV